MDIRKKFFNDEDGETLEQVIQRIFASTTSPSWKVFKVRLDGGLSNLV